MTGKVEKFDAARGFGFIRPDEGDTRDVFVHYKQIIDEETRYKNLSAGDIVAFDVVNSEKGLRATDVRILKRADCP